MVLFIGVFFTAAIVLGALTFDFARLANLKAELEIAADAAAHAGASMMVRRGCDDATDHAAILAEAQKYALANRAMQGTVTIVTNEVGRWNPHPLGAGNFTNRAFCNPSVDATHVEVSRQSNGLFMSLVGVTAPLVRAQAYGYVCPVSAPPPFQVCPTGPKPVLVVER